MRVVSSSIAPLTLANHRRGWKLALVNDAGVVGVGEASPLPGYSPDDAQSCEHALRDVARGLAPSEERDPLRMVEAMIAPSAAALTNTPAARFAIETALFDLAGKKRDRSIAQCLGGVPGARVAVNGVIGTHGDIERWRNEAASLVAREITTIKVKVGRSDLSCAMELAALVQLRETLAPNVRLRLDANGVFGPEARERLAELARIAPDFVEEPTRGSQLVHLGKCDVPWAADETLAIPECLDPLLDASACAVVVLKPALLGGLLRARKIAIRAIAKNRGVVVTHLFDGLIGHAATCALALSLPAPLACGLDRYDDVMGSPYLVEPGFVVASGRPGLGILP